MSSNLINDDVLRSGLMNLVEAATALTELVREVRVAKTNESDRIEVQAVSEDEEQSGNSHRPSKTHYSHSASASRSPSMSNTDAGREIFPQRLMQVLADASISDIITWLPHGKSFMIHRPEAFTEKILPVYFPESRAASSTKSKENSSYKYPSFTRKLNRWGFRQVTKGTDAGAFHHKFFKRCEPDLCLRMVCQKSRRPKLGDAGSQELEHSTTDPPKGQKLRVESRPETARTVTDSESVTSGSRTSQDDSRKKRKTDPSESHGMHQFSISVPTVISNSSCLSLKLPVAAVNTSTSSYFPSTLDELKTVKTASPEAFKGFPPTLGIFQEPNKTLSSVLNAKADAQGQCKTSEQLTMNCNVGSYPIIPSTAIAPDTLARGKQKTCDSTTIDATSAAHIRAEKAKAMLYQAYIQALSL